MFMSLKREGKKRTRFIVLLIVTKQLEEHKVRQCKKKQTKEKIKLASGPWCMHSVSLDSTGYVYVLLGISRLWPTCMLTSRVFAFHA